jgi:3-isopropylmalate dehydrogenase
MEKIIAYLPGDGIGPEVAEQGKKVLEAIADKFKHKFTFKEALVGASAIDATGDPYPIETHEVCRSSDAVLFGAIGAPKYDNDPSAAVRPEEGLLRMRKNLGLYCNIRPVKAFKILEEKAPLKNDRIDGADLVVFRELTSGLYFGSPRGRHEDGKSAFETCTHTEDEILRMAKPAFEAAKNRRNKVTLVDKANVLVTSRLWREVVTNFHKEFYPEIELDFLFVDNAAMQMVLNPKQFDVILTENLFGDIISDLSSVIAGSLGLLASASVGGDVGLFEPIHGSYPQAAGKNIANPMASILAASMLLETSFGLVDEAKVITDAIDYCMKQGFVTVDIDPDENIGTKEVGDKVVEYILAQ